LTVAISLDHVWLQQTSLLKRRAILSIVYRCTICCICKHTLFVCPDWSYGECPLWI